MDENLLALMYDDGEIDDEEFLVLHQANPRKNVQYQVPYQKYERFNLEAMPEDECKVDFRFDKQDVYRLGAALNLPKVFKCQNGVLIGSTEARCICLRRFAYTCRYADLVPRFGRPVSVNNRINLHRKNENKTQKTYLWKQFVSLRREIIQKCGVKQAATPQQSRYPLNRVRTQPPIRRSSSLRSVSETL